MKKINKKFYFTSEAEFKEFEPWLKFKPRLKFIKFGHWFWWQIRYLMTYKILMANQILMTYKILMTNQILMTHQILIPYHKSLPISDFDPEFVLWSRNIWIWSFIIILMNDQILISNIIWEYLTEQLCT